MVCKTPEDLLEYKEKTDYKYGKALVEGCEHKDGKYNKIYEAAVAKAKCKGYSILVILMVNIIMLKLVISKFVNILMGKKLSNGIHEKKHILVHYDIVKKLMISFYSKFDLLYKLCYNDKHT